MALQGVMGHYNVSYKVAGLSTRERMSEWCTIFVSMQVRMF